MTNVNGVNGANNEAYVLAVQSLLQQNKLVNETTIAAEMTKFAQNDGNKGTTVEKNSNDDPSKPVELTDDYLTVKEFVLSDALVNIVKSEDDIKGLMVFLADHQRVLNDPEVQAAIKAKKAELNPPPEQVNFDCQAEFDKLAETKKSGETIDLQIAAEKTKQKILDFVPHIEISEAKDIKANNGAVVQQFIDVAVTGKEPASDSAESLKNIAQTKLTADQKTQLKTELEAIANMSLETLCSEFGITLDRSKLADLGENATPEKVAEQLGYVNELLAQIEGSEAKGKEPAKGLAKVRADRDAADRNIENNNNMIEFWNETYDSFVDLGMIKDGKDPNAQNVKDYQGYNMASLKTVAKADALMASIKPLQDHLLKIQQQLNTANIDLTNIQNFDKEAEKVKAKQITVEDNKKSVAENASTKARQKYDAATVVVTDTKKNGDKDKEKIESSDASTNRKIAVYKKPKANKNKAVATAAVTEEKEAVKVVNERIQKQAELNKLRGKEVEEPAP